MPSGRFKIAMNTLSFLQNLIHGRTVGTKWEADVNCECDLLLHSNGCERKRNTQRVKRSDREGKRHKKRGTDRSPYSLLLLVLRYSKRCSSRRMWNIEDVLNSGHRHELIDCMQHISCSHSPHTTTSSNSIIIIMIVESYQPAGASSDAIPFLNPTLYHSINVHRQIGRYEDDRFRKDFSSTSAARLLLGSSSEGIIIKKGIRSNREYDR